MHPQFCARILLVAFLIASLVVQSVADQAALAPTSAPSVETQAAAARAWIARPAEERQISGFAPAAEMRVRRYESPRKIELWITRIDLTHPGIRFVVTDGADFEGDDDPDNDAFETRCATTLDFARQYGVQLAINTAAFGPFRGRTGEPMNVAGLAAARGRVFSKPEQRYGGIYISKDERVALKAPSTQDENLWHVVPGFRMVLDEGQIAVDPDEANKPFGQINPRTAVGVDREANALWLVVADGRQPERSMGLTLVELACLFESLDCWDALNLDGGGSSTMVVQNGGGGYAVVNTPLNDKTPGKLRQVAHNLGLYLPGEPPTLASPASQPAAISILPALDDKPLYRFSEAEMSQYIGTLQEKIADLPSRAIHLARRNLGQPYEIFLLGEYPFENYDPDPIYCLTKSDCLTHVEHIYALAMSRDFGEYVAALQRLRYRDGHIGMLTRNHYTEADWNPNNAPFFEDLTKTLGGGSVHVPLTQTVRRAKFFAKWEIGQDIPNQPLTDAYIPKAKVASILPELRDGDLVNIVRGNPKEQYVGHVGLVARGASGSINFLHSGRPVVQEESLLGYLCDDTKSLGIKILRPRPEAQTRMRELLNTSAEALRGELSRLSNASTDGSPLGPEFDQTFALQRLQALRLSRDEAPDEPLQVRLKEIDARVCGELGIADEQRAFGVVDLRNCGFAFIRPDAMFYGASVPKIAILLAYFEQDPTRLETLTPQTQRELELMIKRSDNALAAKYSQLVGLEFIQRLVQSDQYNFYDRAAGGGIWLGKHYGIDEPRIGDPLMNHSHAATVRQCLRYFLMLEQGRLGGVQVSEKIRQIFRAPALDFHNEDFVRGLRGRDLTLIRKHGLWEDWHLDVARVEREARNQAYLIAGAVRHPRGEEYLAGMAALLDDHFAAGRSNAFRARHRPYTVNPNLEVTPEKGAGGDFGVMPWFNEALVSWNISSPPGMGAAVEIRVGRTENEVVWSPWLYLGGVGQIPEGVRPPNSAASQPIGTETPPIAVESTSGDGGTQAVSVFPGGRIDVDYFRSSERFDQLEWRVRGYGNPTNATERIRVARIDVCVSDTLGVPESVPRSGSAAIRPPADTRRRLPVPFFSQKSEKPEIAGRICSPTSLAMVMAYRGKSLPVAEVAAQAFDREHDIYGNWPRNVQAAFELGVPGYLTRISEWSQVEKFIGDGQPVIITVRVREPGALRGAPYETTKGHLLVVCGFDEAGMVLVNDPAAATPETGQLRYYREDLEKCWMEDGGGVAYVLLPTK